MIKKICATLLAMLLLMMLAGCSLPFDIPGLTDGPDGHVCSFTETERREPTCSEEGYVKYTCTCGSFETNTIPVKPHTPVDVAARAATCTEGGVSAGQVCLICSGLISGCEPTDALGHAPVVDEAIPPTAVEAGKTEGSHCDRCGTILVKQMPVYANDYTNPERYEGSYAYEHLATLSGGDKLTELYDRIDAQMLEFHLGDTDVGADLLIAEVAYSDLGLSSEQALGVWSAYRIDHPLYYWLSSQIKYSQNALNLLVYEEYARADVRREYNAQIYAAASRAIGSAVSEGTYALTLAIHDTIIEGAYYAYESDGVTPEDSAFAHNVVGVLAEGSGVCESYAKAFQLMLNYCGIENIYVTGYAGEPHAWNLVLMDDGEWYWFDLTWDDSPDRALGVTYNYFCVNDTQSVGQIDGSFVEQSISFMENHTPDAPNALGTNFAYPLPERSEREFDEAEYLIRQTTFVVEGLEYSICGNGEVQLVGIGVSGEVFIPDTVLYDGIEFDVVSIGAFKEGSTFSYDSGSVISADAEVTAVIIGAGVTFVWDSAFESETLAFITVDEDNGYFEAVDGVLFTEGLYTLIHYPSARAGESYTTPATTAEIAYGAFRDLAYLKYLTVSKSVSTVGAVNYGYGYNYGEDRINTVLTYDNEVSFIVASLAAGGRLAFEKGNTVYTVFDDADGVYTDGGRTLVSALDRSATEFVMYSGVEHIGDYALYYCTGIREIDFSSTPKSLWTSITVGKDWKPYGAARLTVIFSDGSFYVE